MNTTTERDLTHDFVLPTLLFAALGGMTWAVRGCSGFGAVSGCVFAGLMWGVAWWFIAREPGTLQTRRYASGWIILALTIGVGISGGRGWAQWWPMFEGRLQTSAERGEWVPISPVYGYLWTFIAGMPWAGLGACALAWCGSGRPTRFWQWAVRIACGVGVSWLLVSLFNQFPQYFMPLYRELEDKYLQPEKYNNLRRLTNDNRAALMHLGLYLGFLLFEVGRRDWKNVTLILTVGVLNGIGWAVLRNWIWAEDLFGSGFNWWRCWESSGGISIGISYGVAYFLVNRRMTPDELAAPRPRLAGGRVTCAWIATWLAVLGLLSLFFLSALSFAGPIAWGICVVAGIAYFLRHRGDDSDAPTGNAPAEDANLERWAVYAGLLLGLGMNLRNGLKGWANLYVGDEEYWSRILWYVFGPVMLIVLVALVWQLVVRPRARNYAGDLFPHAYKLVWLVLIVQNVIAQLVTGPHTSTSEVAFAGYYLVLFGVTAVILHHYHAQQRKAMKGR